MNQPDDIWAAMMNECRKMELPVLPVFGGEPWFSVQYLCSNFLMIEKHDDFTKRCREAGVKLIRINRKTCARLSDVLAMFQRNEGASL